MARKKKWSELTPTQRKAVVIGGAAEVALTAWCLRDLSRRSADEVNGPKAVWRAAMVVQPFGPLAYLWRGRAS